MWSRKPSRKTCSGRRLHSRLSRLSISTATGVAVLALVTAPGDARTEAPAASGRPNVVLILLDAVRADHLGCYGHLRDTSPAIDALAGESVLFETAASQTSWTKPSIPTLLTGLYPIQHRVFTGNTEDTPGHITSDVLPANAVTLAEALRDAGYATAAFVENAQISSFMGFAQGFDAYHENLGTAERITSRFTEWLDASPRRPFFAYVHYLDAHWPYTPPAPFDRTFAPAKRGSVDFNRVNWKYLERQVRSGEITLAPEDLESMRALYDGEIRFTDEAVARLFEALRANGAFENTIVVVTADHGEEFLEHGNIGHGHSLYEEVLHVPLILRVPGAAARRVAEPVALVDVMPTLLDLVGLAGPPGLGGRSLRPWIDGGAAGAVAIFADFRPTGEGGRVVQCVRSGPHKLIRSFAGTAADDEDGAKREWRPPRLEAGQWLEVEGVLEEDGSFLAVEIELLPKQEESRISAVLQDLEETSQGFRLLGLPCRLIPGAKIKDSDDRRIGISALENGSAIRVKGERAGDGVFKVRSLKLLEAQDAGKQEIKARVEAVQADGEARLRLRMLGLDVVVDIDTEFDGAWPGWEPGGAGGSDGRSGDSRRSDGSSGDRAGKGVPAGASGGSSGASAATAAFAEGAERTLLGTELYDLSADPREMVDLSRKRSDLVQKLTALLDAWERQYERRVESAGQDRIALDAETRERLRSLGYIR